MAGIRHGVLIEKRCNEGGQSTTEMMGDSHYLRDIAPMPRWIDSVSNGLSRLHAKRPCLARKPYLRPQL
jgi:hypothetical protein